MLLISEFDDDLLMVREYKSHSDEHFPAYMQANTEAQLEKMQGMLRTTHQHLLEEEDPVQALVEEFVKIY